MCGQSALGKYARGAIELQWTISVHYAQNVISSVVSHS